MHCPGVNATDSIWRVLASSSGISSWTPLEPQHCNPKPNPNLLANQLWYIDFLTPPTPLMITPCLPWISYATQKLILDSCKMLEKQSEAFHMFLWHFFQVQNRILLHIILLKCPHIQIAFLKFTSCDNQVLVGCSNCCCSFKPEIIKSGQSSHKMYSNNIENFQESTSILNAHTKKVCKLIIFTSYFDISIAYLCFTELFEMELFLYAKLNCLKWNCFCMLNSIVWNGTVFVC